MIQHVVLPIVFTILLYVLSHGDLLQSEKSVTIAVIVANGAWFAFFCLAVLRYYGNFKISVTNFVLLYRKCVKKPENVQKSETQPLASSGTWLFSSVVQFAKLCVFCVPLWFGYSEREVFSDFAEPDATEWLIKLTISFSLAVFAILISYRYENYLLNDVLLSKIELYTQFDLPSRVFEIVPTFLLVFYYTWTLFPRFWDYDNSKELASTEFDYFLSTFALIFMWLPMFMVAKNNYEMTDPREGKLSDLRVETIYKYVLITSICSLGLYNFVWFWIRQDSQSCKTHYIRTALIGEPDRTAGYFCKGIMYVHLRTLMLVYTVFIVPLGYNILSIPNGLMKNDDFEKGQESMSLTQFHKLNL